jgi:uncharacterized protein HemX
VASGTEADHRPSALIAIVSGAGAHLAVLLVWVALGLGAILAGVKLRQQRTEVAA